MIKKIDLESHFYDISSAETLQARNIIHWVEGISMCQDNFLFERLDFAEKRLKIMDEFGIEKSVISLAPGIDYLPPAESAPPTRKPTRLCTR